MSMVWYSEQTSEEGRRILQRLESEDRGTIKEQIPGVHIQFGKQDFAYPLESLRSRVRYVRLPAEFREVPCYFVPANGLDKRQIGQLWDNIALTSLEEDVLAALRIIAPKAERVNLVGATERVRERVPILKAIGIEEPIPLRNLGEGMNRLFGVTLALVNAKDGLLLVDEIESGLHYSVQPDLWRLVFQAARQLNVQVFATTHSWDCIKGFQKAAKEDKQAEGLLISLREKGEGQVAAVLFDEHELAVAAREQIEVR